MGRQAEGQVGSGDYGLEGPPSCMCTDLGSGDPGRPGWAGRTLCAKDRLVSVKRGLPSLLVHPSPRGACLCSARLRQGQDLPQLIPTQPGQARPRSWESWEEAPSVRISQCHCHGESRVPLPSELVSPKLDFFSTLPCSRSCSGSPLPLKLSFNASPKLYPQQWPALPSLLLL